MNKNILLESKPFTLSPGFTFAHTRPETHESITHLEDLVRNRNKNNPSADKSNGDRSIGRILSGMSPSNHRGTTDEERLDASAEHFVVSL